MAMAGGVLSPVNVTRSMAGDIKRVYRDTSFD